MRLGKYEELNEQQQEIIYKKYGCLIDCAIDREIDGLKQQMAIEFDSNFSIKIEQKSINIHDDGIYGINIFYVPFDDKTSLTVKTIEPLMKKFLQLREYDNRLAKFDNRTIKVFLSLFNNDDIEFDIDTLDLVKHIKSNSKDVTEINNILSDLSFKIDKLKQDFALNNAFNKQDITEIKILINTIEGAE